MNVDEVRADVLAVLENRRAGRELAGKRSSKGKSTASEVGFSKNHGERNLKKSRRDYNRAVRRNKKDDIASRMEGARAMATGALDDAVAAGDANVSKAFKKSAKSFEAAFQSMTGKKWRVKAGKDLFSATDGKNVVDIFWDWDPIRMTADVEVEGPHGYRARKSLSLRQLGDMGRSGRNGESSALDLIMDMANRLGESAESMVSDIVEACELSESSGAHNPKWATGVLAAYLRRHKVKTESGRRRTADISEFMMMNGKPVDGYWQFKHRDSRNYIFVDDAKETVAIPASGAAFRRGTFDLHSMSAGKITDSRKKRAAVKHVDALAKELGLSPVQKAKLLGNITGQLMVMDVKAEDVRRSILDILNEDQAPRDAGRHG